MSESKQTPSVVNEAAPTQAPEVFACPQATNPTYVDQEIDSPPTLFLGKSSPHNTFSLNIVQSAGLGEPIIAQKHGRTSILNPSTPAIWCSQIEQKNKPEHPAAVNTSVLLTVFLCVVFGVLLQFRGSSMDRTIQLQQECGNTTCHENIMGSLDNLYHATAYRSVCIAFPKEMERLQHPLFQDSLKSFMELMTLAHSFVKGVQEKLARYGNAVFGMDYLGFYLSLGLHGWIIIGQSESLLFVRRICGLCCSFAIIFEGVPTLDSSLLTMHDKLEASRKEGEVHGQFVNGMLKEVKKGKRFTLLAMHDKLEASCKKGEVHGQFVNGMLKEVKKGKRFTLFLRPPHVDMDKTIHVFGTSAACGESLEAAYVVGNFMLECRHQYHPLCFNALLHTSGICVKEGCGMVILAVARAWISDHYSVKDEEDVKLANQDVQGTDTMGVKNGGPRPAKFFVIDVEELASMECVQEVIRDLDSSWRKEKVEVQDVHTTGDNQGVDTAMEKREVAEGRDSVGMNTVEAPATDVNKPQDEQT
ncbi:hypothetical protein L7F22_060365 [Adiantum nelumboides]|nr:hypothetical protein [Adiantum nelumboides]